MKTVLYALSLTLGLVVTTTACTPMNSRYVEYAQVVPQSFPVLLAVGYAPIRLQSGETEQQRMLQAMTASKLEAYRELTEMVYGQKVDAKSNLKDMVITNSALSASVSGVIKGAKVLKTYAVDEVYITELELDFEQVYQLYQATVPTQKIKRIRYYN
ncbi:LPP20 family lipoprotein [Rheinheimera sp. MMS21-TC3]|uniref:LPP20 family lipoprotein n=1 Tax=Rheinheimera sp. MMS21-TC3 TaxID=3072790 RepID=UPI0028C3FF10|nr:LPP20 family lipoprotein [Rheinheimera sp. MMS21-TC3]WNO61844.1 LPP20 family lipoprotein [Rheinheimera sp. MMS21-TC3]